MNIQKHTIQNKYLKVSTLNIGASLFEIFFKPKSNNLILNLGNKNNYKKKHQFIGSTCGRYANRIANASFFINKKKYKISKNEKKNSLHGGKNGFDKKIWTIFNNSKDKIVYELISKDMDQGFPGKLKVRCEYKIKKNKLICKYIYSSDKYTHTNLTNHCYWNLNKNKKINILNHYLKINSNSYLPVDKNMIPIGKIKSVKNTDFDFRKLSSIEKKILNRNKGFDINFVTGKKNNHLVATLVNKHQNIKVVLRSNQPGVQFYTGHKLSPSKNPRKFYPFQGLCLETQHFPNSPNEKNFPSTLVIPNKKYVMMTSYEFKSNK